MNEKSSIIKQMPLLIITQIKDPKKFKIIVKHKKHL